MKDPRYYDNGNSKAKDPNNIKYSPKELKEDIKNSKALEEFLDERVNFKESSKNMYIYQVATYCYFHQKKIDELIEEYKNNQMESHEREKDYAVRKHIREYAKHMIDNSQAKNTILNKVKRIKIFLKDNDVYVPNLNIDLSKYKDTKGFFTKRDLPTKEMIKIAINDANLKHKAIFAWVYTTGSARQETALLTVQRFLDGISEFCKSTTPRAMIEELDGKTECKDNMVVPIIYMEREKTVYPYYTITTPECVQIIIDYIKSNPSLLDDTEQTLFGIKSEAIGSAFKSTNLKFGWGKKGRYNYFGCHRLRHNHFTQIKDKNLANRLEGRRVKDKITQTYDHNDDPEELRKGYIEEMSKFAIFNRYDVMVNSEAYKQLQEQLDEEKRQHKEDNEKYEAELNKLRESNESLAGRVGSVEDMILSNNVNEFKEIISKHRYIKEDGSLMEIVMLMFKDDYQLDNITESMENIADELATRAYLHKQMMIKNNESFLSKKYGERYKQVTQELETLKDDFINSFGLDEFPQGWNNRIDEELRLYKQEILEEDKEIDEIEIAQIMNDIIGLEYTEELFLLNKLKKENSNNSFK